jgi:DNA-binding MarR family transcriptional regulator
MSLKPLAPDAPGAPETLDFDASIKEASKLLPVQLYVKLHRLTEQLRDEMRAVHTENGLTHTQFNVLRALYRSENVGISSREISDELVSRDPDMTGLVDRLEQKGLVFRRRDPADRRRVLVYLTRDGVQATERATPPGVDRHKHKFDVLTGSECRSLERLLTKLLSRSVSDPDGWGDSLEQDR